MNIDSRIRLLGEFDVDGLASAILGQENAAWSENNHRQNTYEVHRQTESIVLIFNESEAWPKLLVNRMPAWDRLADEAVPLMNGIIDKCYPAGGVIIRAMAAKLKAGGKISPHVDSHESFHLGHRIHVPITTSPRVRFMIDGRPHRLEFGQAYEINNQLMHSVSNKSSDDRITYIFDYVPPEYLDRLEIRGLTDDQV